MKTFTVTKMAVASQFLLVGEIKKAVVLEVSSVVWDEWFSRG
jgi:hypothetical protein